MPVGLHLPDLLVLLIILLIFGSKKLPETAAAIGKSIIAFKKGLNESDEQENKDAIQKPALLGQTQSRREVLEPDLVNKKAPLSTVVSATDHPKMQRRDESKVTIYGRLKAIIVDQFHVDEGGVVPSASFVEDFNADSLDLVELVMSLEEEFHLPISDKDVKKITTVQEAEDYIKKRLHERDQVYLTKG